MSHREVAAHARVEATRQAIPGACEGRTEKDGSLRMGQGCAEEATGKAEEEEGWDEAPLSPEVGHEWPAQRGESQVKEIGDRDCRSRSCETSSQRVHLENDQEVLRLPEHLEYQKRRPSGAKVSPICDHTPQHAPDSAALPRTCSRQQQISNWRFNQKCKR
mmetsp:Transcript_57241/g.186077  ORF Transcript_57241/g.186077 Transcript_57241/m.186077 type:complete len:161 (-) Transcript_57241:469-951(-)